MRLQTLSSPNNTFGSHVVLVSVSTVIYWKGLSMCSAKCRHALCGCCFRVHGPFLFGRAFLVVTASTWSRLPPLSLFPFGHRTIMGILHPMFSYPPVLPSPLWLSRRLWSPLVRLSSFVCLLFLVIPILLSVRNVGSCRRRQ